MVRTSRAFGHYRVDTSLTVYAYLDSADARSAPVRARTCNPHQKMRTHLARCLSVPWKAASSAAIRSRGTGTPASNCTSKAVPIDTPEIVRHPPAAIFTSTSAVASKIWRSTTMLAWASRQSRARRLQCLRRAPTRTFISSPTVRGRVILGIERCGDRTLQGVLTSVRVTTPALRW